MLSFLRINSEILVLGLLTALLWAPGTMAAPAENSDLNGDGVVNYDDLTLFSSRYLEQDVSDVDWCAFIEAANRNEMLYGKEGSYYLKHFGESIFN